MWMRVVDVSFFGVFSETWNVKEVSYIIKILKAFVFLKHGHTVLDGRFDRGKTAWSVAPPLFPTNSAITLNFSKSVFSYFNMNVKTGSTNITVGDGGSGSGSCILNNRIIQMTVSSVNNVILIVAGGGLLVD